MDSLRCDHANDQEIVAEERYAEWLSERQVKTWKFSSRTISIRTRLGISPCTLPFWATYRQSLAARLQVQKGKHLDRPSDGVRRAVTQKRYTLNKGAFATWAGRGGVSLDMDQIPQHISHLYQLFPTLFPSMGKELIGTYRAFFPILSDINNNYNYNNIGFPKKEKEHGDDLQDGDTPSLVYAQPAGGINHLPPIQLNRDINPNSEKGPHLRFQSAGKMGKFGETKGKQTPASGGAP